MIPVTPALDEGSPDGCVTRRAILATLAAAALTACSGSSGTVNGPTTQDSGTGGGDDGGGDGGTNPACGGGASNAGSVASYAPGTWTAMGTFIIGHDAGGLFAFSTSCTHRGCTIGPPSSTGATLCPCHGARFDGNGAVTAGPANSPLPHFALTVCDGSVFVDSSATVAAATRTPAA